MISDPLTSGLLIVGSFFLVLGSLGLVRFPDVYNRLHAATKSTTLGASSVLLAGSIRLGFPSPGVTAVICIIFLYLTVPVGAHMISRAAHKFGVEVYGTEEKGED